MNATLVIENGKIVSLNYVLTSSDGEIIDQSEEGEPLLYLHGASNIVPGLENALTGRQVGERLKVAVPPSEGYGERAGTGPQAFERDYFPTEMEIVPGMQFMAQGDDGMPIPLWVADVDDTHIFLDANHPLAGETLHFEVEVLDVRDATPEELEHGHPHGADGHHHHDDYDDMDDYEDEDEDGDDYEDEEDEEEDEKSKLDDENV